MLYKQKQSGFGIIEIIALIFIITFLIIIILPPLSQSSSCGEFGKCRANLSQLGKGHSTVA